MLAHLRNEHSVFTRAGVPGERGVALFFASLGAIAAGSFGRPLLTEHGKENQSALSGLGFLCTQQCAPDASVLLLLYCRVLVAGISALVLPSNLFLLSRTVRPVCRKTKTVITMHELLLFASVPAHQHHDLLQQLAGLTAMQPRYRLERRLLFKAYRKPGYVNTRIGGSQDLQSSEMQRLTKMLNGGMYYTQVVGPVHERDFGSIPPPLMGPGADGKQAADHEYEFDEQPWRLEFRDIPEAGTRSAVTSRVMSNATLPRGDMILPMSAWGYRSVCSF